MVDQGMEITGTTGQAWLELLRYALAPVHDAVLVVAQGRVLLQNNAFTALSGGTDLTGARLADLFTDPSFGELAQRVAGAVDAQVETASFVQGRPVRITSVPLALAGKDVVQWLVREEADDASLREERTRSRMAEEINRVLRSEIQEHRRTQDELRRSRRFARSLIDSSLDMIIAVDRDGLITEFNPAASVRFGYEPEDVLGRPASTLYAGTDEHLRIKRELDAHGAFAGDVRNIDRNGEVFTSFLTASRQYDEDGVLLGSMGVSRDITRARRDEEALRASEERYRDLFENATDLIQSVDEGGMFQYANAMWCSTLGREKKEVLSLHLRDVVHPEDLERYMVWRGQLLGGQEPGPIRARFVARDGRVVHVEGSSSVRVVDGRAVATRSIFRDITGMVEAQASARKQEAKLRALFESGDHMFWTVDHRVALTSFNKGYADMIERLHGVRPEVNTDLDQPRKRFASDSYHGFWEAKYAEAFSGRALRFETDLRDQRGERVCNEIFLSPVFDAQGRVTEVFGVGHEVTEQKEAEEMVREQTARLQAIFESSANMMIWTLDRGFRITSMNEHFQQSLLRGMELEVRMGDDFIAAMMGRVADARYEPFVERYRAALRGEPQQFEVELRNRSGRPLWVENFLNPIRVNGEVVEVSCLAHGITDKKEAQRKLLESLHEKEVLLKEVHHRVKNNLQIISSILNLQGGYVDDDPRMLELLRESQGRIRSMSFIHESLYQNTNFSSIDLADYIDGLSRNLMHSYSLHGRVELVKRLEHVQLGLDQAIPCGLVLNELISNALKHAFPGGGEGRIELGLRLDQRTVHITVSDNGKGLPQGFDEERDANLGLQLVDTLIGQLDGRIQRMNGTGVAYLITFELPK
ncbi:MAG: PAS domain S-box protein [Flavobacteriales bacterium]|nr:PAS domain S-box protein [Flavobacteriales bacterium]